MLPLFYIKYIKTTGKYSKYSPSILQNTARGTSTPFWGNPILPRSRSHMLHCVLVSLQRGPCTALNVPSTRCSAWPQGPAGSTSSGRRTGRSASLLIQPHSTSHLTPPHTSLHLTPPHSTSHLTPPHSTSVHQIPPQSTSFHLPLPHSTSLRLTPPHSAHPLLLVVTLERCTCFSHSMLCFVLCVDRAFYLALYKHMMFLENRGCPRTALEYCKLILR